MHLRNHMLSTMAAAGLALTGLATGAVSHVHAATLCDDGTGNEFAEVPILTSPITLGLELGDGGTLLDPHVGLCFGTNSEAQNAQNPPPPEAAGGAVVIDVLNPASNDGFSTGVNVLWDSNSNVKAGVEIASTPTYSVQPGGANGGQTITVSIPVSVCAGPCISNPGQPPYTTGAIVGTLSETPPPAGGQGAAFQLSSLCIEVDGVPLTNCGATFNLGGITTTGAKPVDASTSPAGPCVLSLCVPVAYVGLSGAQLATLYLPGTGAGIPVSGEPACIYWNNPGPPPAGCTS